MGKKSTILFVDDNADMLASYEAMLKDEYEVLTASGGKIAHAKLDEDVDVVFLDRRMPGMTGDEFLHEMRNRGFEIPVAMLSAIEPDGDIVDLPIDDYITKPVNKAALKRKIEVLINRAEFDRIGCKFHQLASKKATLEAQADFDHQNSEEYHELVDRMKSLRDEIDTSLDSLLEENPETVFKSQ